MMITTAIIAILTAAAQNAGQNINQYLNSPAGKHAINNMKKLVAQEAITRALKKLGIDV